MEHFVSQAKKIKLPINADKVEAQIAQSLDCTHDFTRKKIKIAKFLRDAKAQVKKEEYKLTEKKWAKKKEVNVNSLMIALKNFAGNPRVA